MNFRSMHVSFWSDNWVRDLNPLDRYLFQYLFQNAHSNICGIYELPISTMSFETGIEREELLRSMLPRLQPKVWYVDGWMIVINFQRYQASRSKTVLTSIENGIEKVPKEVLKFAKEKGHFSRA